MDAIEWAEQFEKWLGDGAHYFDVARSLIGDRDTEIVALKKRIAELEGGEPPPATDTRYVLERFPYVSQWGPGADRAPGDCGPAAACSAIRGFTDQYPTVDEVAIKAGMKAGELFTNFGQLEHALNAYGLKSRYVRPLTGEIIRESIDAGNPCLALVKYDILSIAGDKNQDTFSGAHFVLVLGYQLGPGPVHDGGTIIYHDSDWKPGFEERGGFRETPWATFFSALGSTSKTPGNSLDNHGAVISK